MPRHKDHVPVFSMLNQSYRRYVQTKDFYEFLLHPSFENVLGICTWSRSRSRHGANWKGLSQGSCMPNIIAPSWLLQKIWTRFKFLWWTEGQTDKWVLMSSLLRKAGDKKFKLTSTATNSNSQNWSSPLNSQINMGLPRVMGNPCMKYHWSIITECRMQFNIYIWSWQFDPKFNRSPSLSMGNTFQKWHLIILNVKK